MINNIDLFGAIGDFENDKVTFINKLHAADGKDITVNISSLGGNVDDAFAIYDELKAYSGHVTAKLTGFVASAATIIAMGADEVLMSENAMFLVHKSMSGMMQMGYYNEDDIDQLIKELEKTKDEHKKVDLIIANIYSKATGRRAKTMLDLMAEDKWLTYDEAKDFGFIDGKLKGQKMSNNEFLKMVACVDESKLPKLPDSITNQINNNKMNEEVKGLVSELKDFIASKFAAPVKVDNVVEPTAEVKILDDEEVKAKFANIEESMTAELTAKNTEIENLQAEIAKLTATATSTETVEPTIDEPTKSEWDLQAESLLNSLPNVFKNKK